MTGFSAVIGSWKIMAMRVPRRSRSRAGVACEHVLALEPHLARRGGELARQQAHHRLGGDRLAGARLADDADDLAGADREGDVLDGMRPVRAAAAGRR